jgi:hypothetical protein
MKGVSLLAFFLGGTILLFVLFAPSVAIALPDDQPVSTIANRLVNKQDPNGAWPGEGDFTGSIMAGLAIAYQTTSNPAYKTAAELGGSYIINLHGNNPFGDEAYALALLSDITKDPNYANAVKDFYNSLDTYAYIWGFKGTDPSNAVFYIAQHVVAAHKVGAKDAGIWRDALIQFLSLIDDDVAYYPVMSLGVATWALAQTGPMDDTKIDPFGLTGEDYWKGVTLNNLPALLSGHQVLSGKYAGSFYHRFDHTAAGLDYQDSGYTEDTVFGVLGLLAANKADVDLNLWANIILGRTALATGVAADGIVYEHIWLKGASYYTYAGEVLQAFAPISEAGYVALIEYLNNVTNVSNTQD